MIVTFLQPTQIKGVTVVATAPKQLGNHVRKTTVAPPVSAYYPQKTIQANPGVTLSPVVTRPVVVPKTSTTPVSSQPPSSDLVIEGRPIPPATAGTYEPPHARVVPTSAIEETPGHPRVFLEEKRPAVHGEFIGIHPCYPNQRFLEPPRVDVTRLSGSSPSTPSPAGRTHESEPHAPPHHSAIAGYEMVSCWHLTPVTLLPVHAFLNLVDKISKNNCFVCLILHSVLMKSRKI